MKHAKISAWISMAAVVFMVLPLFASCAPAAPTETAAETAAETTAETEAAETEAAAQQFAGQTLTIHWAQWDPANFLQELSKGFEAETGAKVVVEQTPWADFQNKVMAGMAAQSDAWDIVVGDSQWLGAGAINGWYVDLTQWAKDNKVDQTMTEAAMTAYAEYPKGSKQYWAVPVEGDALGFAYRKDLFEDPANKEDFKAKYGYDLDVPKDMQAFKDISEFFYNPDKKMYGAALYGDNGYDSLVMIQEWAIWAFGGELGDYANYKVEGILNNEGGVMGTQWYRDMWAYQPPNYEKAFFNEANDVFKAGTVPITSNYFAFFPGLADKTQNKFADVTGFFAAPPNKTFDGKEVQVTALGGQGASIITFSKKQDLATAWLSWFIKPETQMAWAKLGGFTCDKATLASDEFMNATPFNPAFATSMAIMKDFWAVPEYADLLTIMSEEGGKFIINGQGTAKTNVDNVAKRWTEVFEKAGYYK